MQQWIRPSSPCRLSNRSLFFSDMIIAEKWNWDWTLDYCVWHDGHCLFREGDLMASPTMRVGSGLPLQPVDASTPVEVRALWWGWGVLDDFEGMESAYGYGNLLQCMQCPHSNFENLLVAAASWGFGAEIQALPAPGHQKTDMLLKWCTFLYFEWHAYIFSTGSEMLHSTSSTCVLLNVQSQCIVQPNYIYVAKSMPLSDFVQYFSP